MFLESKVYHPSNQVDVSIEEQVNTTIKENNDMWLVQPKQVQKKLSVIFYPGGLVDADSYLPLAISIAEEGYPVYIGKMPLDLAVFDVYNAETIIQQQNIESFVIGGHSLGGTMASRFAHETSSPNLKGVFFLASYPDGKGELKSLNLPVISITASEDKVLNQENYEEARNFLPKQTIYYDIQGGNHGGFGSYGAQEGDGTATIDNVKQQKQVSEQLNTWLESIEQTK